MSRLAGPVLAVLAVLSAGCRLPGPSGPRLLEMAARLERSIPEGERTLVASWTASGKTRIADRLLQLSGRVESEFGDQLPNEVIVRAEIRDLDSGELRDGFRVIVERSTENSFRKSKKFPKSIASGSLILVTVEPLGADLPQGTRLSVCLDLVGKRSQLREFPSCAAGNAATTLSGIQRSVFSGRCAQSGCHDRQTAEQGLILEPGESYGRLVDVNAVQYPPDRRVRPRDPERSYLIKKLRGSQPIGGRMPLGGPFLTDAELAGIVEWIENGAADN